MMLQDATPRSQASDPECSFIVQAPAGSGKTELLTQRFLRLLSRVTAPEQIVALTFTRKAASEMRERILLALQRSASGYVAQSPHQQATLDYAKAALAQDRRYDWQLLNHAARLRIMTIDSLCQSITQAIPLQEQQVPYADISPDAFSYYRQAAMSCIQEAIHDEQLQPAICDLLLHLDNRQDKLLELLCDLLGNREQWLEAVFSARRQNKEVFEAALQAIETHELSQFKKSIPQAWQNQLCTLSRLVANVEANPLSTRYALTQWQTFTDLDIEIAKSLAHLLLTGKEELRNSFDHHVGLKKDSCDGALYSQLKNDSKEMLSALQDYPDFCKGLVRMKNLPQPQYNPRQWQVLQSMITLLPRLAAHLQLVFCAHDTVDFTAVSQQALVALGSEEDPTDLALYLDQVIHHLLIDEFQDTSIQQFQLIQRLVQGWQHGDGKTLFIVGDPMQSIYRFRQAEVGLFLKAQQQGIADVALTPLELTCNFRSTQTVVDWVNQQFNSIFPPSDDMESGAVSYHNSVPVLAPSEQSFIKAIQLADKQQEAEAIIHCIENELAADSTTTIAVLVRSRGQLRKLVPLLRAKNIVFQGVEIEQLATLPHVQDHWTLTKALLMPADRLSWLALLRSPACGLTLTDLHALANYDKKQSILNALIHAKGVEGLTQDGLLRAQFIGNVLQHALHSRHQQCLVDWLMQCSQHLFGDLILTKQQQEDLEQFWLLLENYSQDGLLPDMTQFARKLNELYSQRVTPSRLQIMTIHKSKGLEFDTVILPGLGSKSRQSDKPLLRWLKLPTSYAQDLLLMSPVRANSEQRCLLYDYLGELSAEKDYYEQQRLLYVAVTRAKKRLYLFDHAEKASAGSFRAFLQQQVFDSQLHLQQDENGHALPVLKRLPSAYYKHTTVFPEQAANPISPLTPSPARFLGVIAHELLQWIGDNHPQNCEELPWYYAQNLLKKEGYSPVEQEQALHSLHQQITRFLANPVGQWISQAHEEEQNEFAYLIAENDQIKTRIIDRTFCELGIRWIIDFKTGVDDHQSQDKHRQQVQTYAHHMSLKETKPIYCGLYYLATGQWVHWAFNESTCEIA